MAGHNNKNNSRHVEQPAAHHLMLATVETLLNAFIELDEETRIRANALHGLVVRVKVLEPYKVFYLLFTYEGIEVSDEQPGPVTVRLGGRLMDIISYVTGVTPPTDTHRIRLWGDAHSITALRQLMHDFNLRTAAQRWLKENLNFDGFDGLWDKVKRHDPSWLSDFLPMPGLMKETLAELKTLNQALKEQQDEFTKFREGLRQQRTHDLLCMIIAFVAISLGIDGLHASGGIAAMGTDKIVMVVTGVALLLSRLRKNV